MASILGIALWALIPGFVAKKKGRNFWGYYFLSFLISPLITMIITFCLSNISDKKEAEALFERIMNFSRQDNHFVYGIFLDDKLIGFLNDCEIKDATIELGYVIAPNYQGKGFATEAVQCCIDELFEMGFAHVRAGFFEENMASCRVMQKCGMHKIDLEEDIEYKGILHHCLYYEIDRTQA
jgi:RimJ/RimL family protein N-acetyltransferase